MIRPEVQYPHCSTCSSINARCNGCECSGVPSPSSVVTGEVTALTGRTHDRVDSPFIMTEHAPHWARPHPNFGPVRPSSSRNTYKSGVSPDEAIAWRVPFTTIDRPLFAVGALPLLILLCFLDQIFYMDRQVANSLAGGVIDRVRDRAGSSNTGHLADTFDAYLVERDIRCVEQLNFQRTDVSIHGHRVFRDVVVDESAVARIDFVRLRQRRADTPDEAD